MFRQTPATRPVAAPRSVATRCINLNRYILRSVIDTAEDGDRTPPRFLRLAGHPLRWRLLSELARSDRRVGELCDLAGRRQSLVSYHLRQLRDGGVVSTRRSAADGRDVYYVLDLARCGQLLSSAGMALHPGLATDSAPSARASAARRSRACCFCARATVRARRSARRSPSGCPAASSSAASAGSHPKPLHRNAVRVMRERGIDISGRRSKHLTSSPLSASTT